MGIGSALTKIMVLTLQLAIVIAIAGSFITLFTEGFDFEYGEPVIEMPEEIEDPQQILDNGLNISIYVPLNLTIGGYWSADFQYSYVFTDGNDVIQEYEAEPIEIEPGEKADISLLLDVHYQPSEEQLYNMMSNGTTMSFSMSTSIGYMANIFSLEAIILTSFDVGPFVEIEIDEDNASYDGNDLYMPVKLGPVTEELGGLGFNETELNELLDSIPEDLNVRAFNVNLTDEDGTVFWQGVANLSYDSVDRSLIIDIIDIDAEILDGVIDGHHGNVHLQIFINTDSLDGTDDLPEEILDILDMLDGVMIFNVPANEMIENAMEGHS